MTDPTSPSRAPLSISADDQRHIRLSSRQLPTRRLVVLTLLGGAVLSLLGIVAFWLVIHEFSLIDSQQQQQASARSVLNTLTELDAVLRQGTNLYVGLIHAHEADPKQDTSSARAALTANVQTVDAAMDGLGVQLKAISYSIDEMGNYQQLRKVTAEYLLARDKMVDDYISNGNLERYYAERDRIQDVRTVVASYLAKIRSGVDPKLVSAVDAANIELKRTFLISCASLGGSGVVMLILGFMLVRYVYKRDQIEADLRRTTEMWIATLNTLKQGVAMYGFDQRLVLWNSRYPELHGIDPDRLYAGMPAAEVMKISRQRKSSSLEEALERYKGYLVAVRRGEVVEREWPWVDDAQIVVAFHPMSDDYFVLTLTDMTQVRKAEKLKNEFISTVSHELRTPLTSIIGSLTLLVDGVAGELPDKARRLIAMAEKNSQRLGRLINDILDLEKAEAGRMTLQFDQVRLLPLLQHSLELNQSYAARFDVALRLQFNVDDASVSVRGDEARLLQVMSNLLSNAIKHSPPQSQVLVEVTQTSEIVRVTVHDAGSGIAEEFKERVFQRFAQADTSDARREAGTGLGLAITKQLVEQHGGQIGFDTGHSRVGDGRGASFWFELPVIKTAASPAELTEPLNMNVVLCEDDPDVAEVMIERLRLEGCNVRHVDRSTSVHAQLDDTVSVLLVDLDLQDDSALDLVAELRKDKQWCKLPVLVMSGKRLLADERAMLDKLGISAWFGKPVDRDVLRAALRRITT